MVYTPLVYSGSHKNQFKNMRALGIRGFCSKTALVILERPSAHVGLITLNNPKKLNMLTEQVESCGYVPGQTAASVCPSE